MKSIKKISRLVALIICMPVVGMLFVRPDMGGWKGGQEEESTLDGQFLVRVHEGPGDFCYSPEELTRLLMFSSIPEDMTFSVSEDYIEGMGTVQDPEQEYLKALSIVCRSNVVNGWLEAGCPDVLEFERLGFAAADLFGVYRDAARDEEAGTRINEIKKAAAATMGAVITKEGQVIAAPFFTTGPSDMLVGEAGDGVGFSLNYAWELARKGAGFYEILKYFFDDIKVDIYE